MSDPAPGALTPRTLPLLGDSDAAACTGDFCAVPSRPVELNDDRVNDEHTRRPAPGTSVLPHT